MRLEPELWDALAEICTRERQDLPGLMRQIEAMSYAGNRTSAVRVFVVQYFRTATPDPVPVATNTVPQQAAWFEMGLQEAAETDAAADGGSTHVVPKIT
jgi:predicted DNA-binding ribbon-helix-helix protein